MTKIPAPLSRTAARFSPRLRRIAAVLGLCAVVMPVSGFWVDVNDAARGIAAVRMRLNHAAAPALPERSAFTTGPAVYSFPLSPDKARFRAILRDIPASEPSGALALPERAPGAASLLDVHNGEVVLTLADGSYLPLRRISDAKPSQNYRLWAEKTSFLPADGRHRNAHAPETRWLTDTRWEFGEFCKNDAESDVLADMQRLLARIRAPFSASPHPKSAQYMELINNAARRFGLSPQLIYAIMRTESSFNPFAVSNTGALGLMQVIPESAGNEVRVYLTGIAEKPTTAMLFDPKKNIEYGSAYLHLLATRYFADVTNQTSREICIIAGYNAGPRAVLRIFGPDTGQALSIINALPPEELFQMLTRKMPTEETRQYLGKVLSAIGSYPG